MDASSEKALFRRGEALFCMKEFDRARDDFQHVVQLYPANKAAKSQVWGRLSLKRKFSIFKPGSAFIFIMMVISITNQR